MRYTLAAASAGLVIIAAATMLLPGAPTVSTVGMAVVWLLVALGCYHLSPYRNRGGRIALVAAWTLMMVLVVGNTYIYTTVQGGTLTLPSLENFDSGLWFYQAREMVEGRYSFNTQRTTILLFATVMRLSGGSVALMMMWSVACSLVSVVITGYLAGRLAEAFGREHRDACRWSTAAMALIASVALFAGMGSALLKDPYVVTAMALCALGLLAEVTTPGDGRHSRRYLLLSAAAWTAGVALLVLMRWEYLLMAGMGVVLCLRLNRRSMLLALFFAVTIAAGLLIINNVYEESTAHVAGYIDTSIESNFTPHDDHHSFYVSHFSDPYLTTFPLWLKVAALPLTCAVQYVIPLIWNAAADLPFGLSFAYAHFSLPWYAIGFCILWFLLMLRPGMVKRMPMLRLVAWGVVVWVIPAYLTAGSVARYTLGALPVLIPAAVAAIALYRRRRSMAIGAAVYATLLIIGLSTIYYLQCS